MADPIPGTIFEGDFDSDSIHLNQDLVNKWSNHLCVSKKQVEDFFKSAKSEILTAISNNELPEFSTDAPESCKFYQKRYLKISFDKFLLSWKVLGDVNEIFVISGITYEHLLHCLYIEGFVDRVALSSSVFDSFEVTVNIRLFVAGKSFKFGPFSEKFSTKVVHHLEFTNRSLVWIESTGSIENLKKHLHDSQRNKFEGDKIDKKLVTGSKELPYDAKRATFIVGNQNAGKTTLFGRLMMLLKSKKQAHVFYTTMAQVMANFSLESVEPALSKIVSRNTLAKEYLKFDKKYITDVFIDDCDKYEDTDSNRIQEVLHKFMRLNPQVRLWVALRPRMSKEVSKHLPVLTCEIKAFQENETKEYLHEYLKWSSSFCTKDIKALISEFQNKALVECGPEFVTCPAFMSIIAKHINLHMHECTSRLMLTQKWSQALTYFVIVKIYDDFIENHIKLFRQKSGNSDIGNTHSIMLDLENVCLEHRISREQGTWDRSLTNELKLILSGLGILKKISSPLNESLSKYFAARRIVYILCNWNSCHSTEQEKLRRFFDVNDFEFVRKEIIFVDAILRLRDKHKDLQFHKALVSEIFLLSIRNSTDLEEITRACVSNNCEYLFTKLFYSAVKEENAVAVCSAVTIKLAIEKATVSHAILLFNKLKPADLQKIAIDNKLCQLAVQTGKHELVYRLVILEEIKSRIKAEDKTFYRELISECVIKKQRSNDRQSDNSWMEQAERHKTTYDILYNVRHSDSYEYQRRAHNPIFRAFYKIQRSIRSSFCSRH